MKKLVLIYGLIAGFITSIGFLTMGDEMDFDKGMIYGFASMILAFSLIFVATIQYRKQNGGTLTFGKAFLIGLYISLIASTVYVGLWLITYYNFHPDFMEKYSACVIDKLKAEGATQAIIDAKTAEMEQMKVYYKNPLYVILMTYSEILPLSLVVSLISAAVLKRKPKTV
jgi:hypothetical protein